MATGGKALLFILGNHIGDRVAPEKRKALPPSPMKITRRLLERQVINMGRPPKDLTGKKYGHLEVIDHVGSGKHRRALWKCRCDCGNVCVKNSRDLQRVQDISCGCTIHHRETPYKYKHQRLQIVWTGMKKRCLNENSTDYKNYGAKGIKVCEEWAHDYSAFERWAIEKGYDPTAKHGECTLDRINNNGDYEPSNCRWANNKTQSLNRSTTRPIEINGRTYYLNQLSTITGLSRSFIVKRLNEGWDIEQALTKDIEKCRRSRQWQKNLENFGFLKSLTIMSSQYP